MIVQILHRLFQKYALNCFNKGRCSNYAPLAFIHKNDKDTDFMMKVKYFLVALTIAGLMGTLPSCTLTQDDTLDNLTQSDAGTFSTLGTVMMNGELLSIESDRYGTLMPENPEMISQIDADSTGQRVLIGFVYLNYVTPRSTHESYPVRIVDLLYKVETRRAEMLKADSVDIFGTDPLQITNASLSKNHLNIQYTYEGSAQTYHRFNLIVKEGSSPDTEGLLPVELRHDAGGDYATTSTESMISFTLESIDQFYPSGYKGFRIFYNSGANSRAEWKALKE